MLHIPAGPAHRHKPTRDRRRGGALRAHRVRLTAQPFVNRFAAFWRTEVWPDAAGQGARPAATHARRRRIPRTRPPLRHCSSRRPSWQEDDDPIWPSARIALAEALWGEGFLFPGGREETLRLASPLGLSAASSLLLLGAGSGGPARCIAAELGGWVTGYEANARLVALAANGTSAAGLGRRAQVETWNPTAPAFRGTLLPPCRRNRAAARRRATRLSWPRCAGALKSGGQFAAGRDGGRSAPRSAEPMVAHWIRLQRRPADTPTELTITGKLKQLGFDVPVVEDMSRRHIQYVIKGWRSAVRCHAGRASNPAPGRPDRAGGRTVAGPHPHDAGGPPAPGALARDRPHIT